MVCLAVLSYAGHIILFPNLIHTKFGVENSLILLGICGIFAGISSLIGPILTYFINDLEDYLITYQYLLNLSIIIFLLLNNLYLNQAKYYILFRRYNKVFIF